MGVVHQNLEVAEQKSDILERLGLIPQGYFLATVHRQENVDDEAQFSSIRRGLEAVADGPS